MPDYHVLRTGDVCIARDDDGWSAAASDRGPRPSLRAADVAAASSAASGKRARKFQSVKKPTAEDVLRAFNTWAFKREQPSDLWLMKSIIANAISLERPIRFVLYWGKGPRCRPAEPEAQCLDFLARMVRRVREVYAPGASLHLICTDTHAQLNGHSPACIRAYFAALAETAARRGFRCCRLSHLMPPQIATANERSDEVVPEETFARLSASARKWYRGSGTAEQGALDYYRLNMIEKRTVELAFPQSIFISFNGSDLRSLFPSSLPVFHMYSVKRGVANKPWFLPSTVAACDIIPCQCAAQFG
jgi:hypothetical protein